MLTEEVVTLIDRHSAEARIWAERASDPSVSDETAQADATVSLAHSAIVANLIATVGTGVPQ